MDLRNWKGCFLVVTAWLLLACQEGTKQNAVTQAQGFIGFKNNQPWAVTFNDCTVHRFAEAKAYYWFDRTLSQISCYSFTEADKAQLADFFSVVYQKPSLTAPSVPFKRFEQLQVSASGWGRFPQVFARQGEHWVQVKEGWIYLKAADLAVIEVYSGQQDQTLKAAHDKYYSQH